MRQATFGTDVRGHLVIHDRATGRGPAAEVAIAGSSQCNALVMGAPTAQVTGELIRAHLSVTNPTDQIMPIVVFPAGGAFPHGGTTPFTLVFSAGSGVKYTGPLFPPAPPPWMHIDIPPATEVGFEATIWLKHWSWTGDPEVSLDWGFHVVSALNGNFAYVHPPPGGTLTVRLPRR